MRRVEVVPSCPHWQKTFELESKRLKETLGEIVVAIHHIGSTAIPGIYAKPIIDILMEVTDILTLDQHNSSMEKLGYKAMGEFGIPGRRFFRRYNLEGSRSHHLHSFSCGEKEVERHLTFRDYMLAHPMTALEYSDLKRQLAGLYPTSIDDYMDGKDGFIQEIDRKAKEWRNQEIGSDV